MRPRCFAIEAKTQPNGWSFSRFGNVMYIIDSSMLYSIHTSRRSRKHAPPTGYSTLDIKSDARGSTFVPCAATWSSTSLIRGRFHVSEMSCTLLTPRCYTHITTFKKACAAGYSTLDINTDARESTFVPCTATWSCTSHFCGWIYVRRLRPGLATRTGSGQNGFTKTSTNPEIIRLLILQLKKDDDFFPPGRIVPHSGCSRPRVVHGPLLHQGMPPSTILCRPSRFLQIRRPGF
jgi:hypothetical protein